LDSGESSGVEKDFGKETEGKRGEKNSVAGAFAMF
jgi:hypothetical protein